MSKDGLLLLRTFCAIVLGSNLTAKKRSVEKVLKFYRALMIIMIISAHFISLREKIVNVYNLTSYLYVFIDVSHDGSLFVLNICSVVVSNFYQENVLQNFENLMTNMDWFADPKRKEMRRKLVKYICREHIFNWFVVGIFLTLLMGHEFMNRSVVEGLCYLSTFVGYFLMNLSVMRIYIYLLSLKFGINNMNSVLLKPINLKTVETVVSIYDSIFTTINALNKIFGIEILCILGISVATLLQPVVLQQQMGHYLTVTMNFILILKFTIVIVSIYRCVFR